MVVGTASPCSGTGAITRYEQSVQRRKTEGAIQKGAIDVYAVVPQRGGDSFIERLAAARETRMFGPDDSSNQTTGDALERQRAVRNLPGPSIPKGPTPSNQQYNNNRSQNDDGEEGGDHYPSGYSFS